MDTVSVPIPIDYVGCVKRAELVRLLADSLQDLGYSNSARALELESGVESSSNTASEFISLLSTQRYDEALGLLDRLPFKDGGLGRKRARSLITQERYFNCLFEEKMDEALTRLQEEVFAQSIDDDGDLDALASMLACPSPDELRMYSGRLRSRQAKRFCASGYLNTAEASTVLDCVRALLDTDAVVPPQRLLLLLGQALAFQGGEKADIRRLREEPLPLLRDLKEVESQRHAQIVPSSICRKVIPISGKSGLVEVWCVCFENDEHASRIAVGTREGSLLVIETLSGNVVESHDKVFRFDGRPIVHLDWMVPFGLLAVSRESPHMVHRNGEDDQMDESDGEIGRGDERQQRRNSSLIRLVLPGARELRPSRTVFHGGRPLARWTSRGGIITCGADGWIRHFNNTLNLESSVKVERVIDIAANADRTVFFMACADNVIRSFRGTQVLPSSLSTVEPIVAIACGANTICASLSNQTLMVWNMKDVLSETGRTRSSGASMPVVFRGFSRKRFVLRPSVGHGDIVAIGSEDGTIHVYSCVTVAGADNEVALLKGHTAGVNEVCFAPGVPGKLASVGDDGSLRLWSRRAQDE